MFFKNYFIRVFLGCPAFGCQ